MQFLQTEDEALLNLSWAAKQRLKSQGLLSLEVRREEFTSDRRN